MERTRAPNDNGSLWLEQPISKTDNAVIGMQLALHGLVTPGNYGRNFLGMDKRRLLDLRIQTQWEVERGSN